MAPTSLSACRHNFAPVPPIGQDLYPCDTHYQISLASGQIRGGILYRGIIPCIIVGFRSDYGVFWRRLGEWESSVREGNVHARCCICMCVFCTRVCLRVVCMRGYTRAHVCVCGGCVSACMFASAPREGGSGMAIARQRVAYPGGETSLTGPEDRIWPDDS